MKFERQLRIQLICGVCAAWAIGLIFAIVRMVLEFAGRAPAAIGDPGAYIMAGLIGAAVLRIFDFQQRRISALEEGNQKLEERIQRLEDRIHRES